VISYDTILCPFVEVFVAAHWGTNGKELLPKNQFAKHVINFNGAITVSFVVFVIRPT
jgi:hypothetical protein